MSTLNDTCGNHLGFKQKKKVVKDLRRRFRLDGARLIRHSPSTQTPKLEIHVEIKETLKESQLSEPAKAPGS
ncbi:hypothetical protein VNI00_014222 [Paramarasmius palmivorus]|uniref:Uncharacterized protein n=1 Tax=Paramarasmius palmivorus TaxID=297713 RepID=A0AAW0BVL3_9AGAR